MRGMQVEVPKGLEGVEVDVTKISLVDGERGQLSYRGHDVAQLIEWPFTRVVLLVLTGEDPTNAERSSSTRRSRARRGFRADDAGLLTLAAKTDAHPMAVLQGLIPLLSRTRRIRDLRRRRARLHGRRKTAGADRRTASTAQRRRAAGAERAARSERALPGADGLATRNRLPALAHAFDVTQILQIEHSFNASTFAARVVASTLAPVENVLAAALGALHGALHGGADQAALEMAIEVGDPARAADFVDECLATGRKIMGMGHREYRVLDPRARFVKALAANSRRAPPRTVVPDARSDRSAHHGTDGRTRHGRCTRISSSTRASCIARRDCRRTIFTAAFAMARVYGYLAHFIESRINNRIIRPAAKYIGARVAD